MTNGSMMQRQRYRKRPNRDSCGNGMRVISYCANRKTTMTKRNPRTSDLTAMEILRKPAKAASGAEWSRRHDRAFKAPNKIEKGIVYLLVGWATYADEHYEAYNSAIADDHVLGPEWEKIGEAL